MGFCGKIAAWFANKLNIEPDKGLTMAVFFSLGANTVQARILVAEAEASMANDLISLLESLGYSISALVSSGEATLHQLEEDQPDLILMDMNLNGLMGSGDTFGQIRRRWDIPIVFVSDNANWDRLEPVDPTHPYACLVKPFSGSDLKSSIDLALYLGKLDAEKRQEQSLRLAIENSLLGGIVAVDIAGRISYVNLSFCKTVGYSEQELIGQTAPFVYWPEEEIETIENAFMTTLAGNAPPQGFELVFKRSSGDRFPVHILISVLSDGQNKLGWVANVIDITQRRQNEAALMETEALYSQLVTSMPDIVVRTDMYGNIVFANEVALRVTGYQWAEVAGKNMLEFIDPEDHTRIAENFLLMFDHYIPAQEYHLVKKNGQKMPIEAHGNVLRHQDGTPFGTVQICRDVTERRRIHAEREQLIEDLQAALAEVKTLRGFIPICTNCKKIRNDHGYWQQIENYIQEHSAAKFSHSICPECIRILYPDYAKRKNI